jgi:Na+/melibiose symporter-like transporter
VTTEILSKRILYAHGTLGMPLAVIGYPLAIWIPAHYSGGLGISLATVGTILMLARLTDVITDPLMGELSDRWRTPIGRRRPWLFIGPPVMMLGVYHLFMPSEGVGIAYFLFWLTIFFVGSTMIALPPSSLGRRAIYGLPSAKPRDRCPRNICVSGTYAGRIHSYDYRDFG